jgi:hypothetical protein
VFLHQKCINSGISKPNHTSLLIEIPHDIFWWFVTSHISWWFVRSTCLMVI